MDFMVVVGSSRMIGRGGGDEFSDETLVMLGLGMFREDI
jgi:hypothetical protein